MPERHVEARANRGDPHVRRDYCLAAADRAPHRLAEHRVHASAAVLHFPVDPDDCILAVGDGRTVEQLDELGHETFAEFHTRFEQRAEITDEVSGEGVQDNRHADCARNWPRRPTRSSERTVSRILMILRILTITSSSCGPRGYCCTPFVLLTTA